MWGTKKTNNIVVVTIQGQVKTARTKPNDQHLEQVIKSQCTKNKKTAIRKQKNRQKGDQFFYQMSDFCENYNPHSSYHTTTVGKCLVDIWLAESCKLTL